MDDGKVGLYGGFQGFQGLLYAIRFIFSLLSQLLALC